MLVILTGKANVGKDTFGKYLAKALEEQTGQTFATVAYADELKKRVAKDFSLSSEQLYGYLKEVPDERYVKNINTPKGLFSNNKELGEGFSFWTPREILQFIGTDCYRAIDNNFWVKALFKYLHKNNIKNAIITDGRFANEVDAVLDRGGYHIKIVTTKLETTKSDKHLSETSLDANYKIDFKIQNDGSLAELKKAAEEVAVYISKIREHKELHYGN